MSIKFVATDAAPKAIGPYSQATIANGLIYTAGQIALDPASMEVVPGDVKAQTERVMANLQAVLKAAGSDLSKVVKTTVILYNPVAERGKARATVDAVVDEARRQCGEVESLPTEAPGDGVRRGRE